MGKSGGGGSSSGEIRYAPYLEAAHTDMLNHGGSDTSTYSLIGALNGAFDSSPYANYETLDIDEGFFGIIQGEPDTTYEMKNFPSLFDMFGKFLGGLDVHDLWAKVYEDVVHGPEIENAVTAHSEVLQDDIDTNVMPRFLAGMRDINAVQSSAFIVGKSLIASTHVKSVNDFQAKLRMGAINLSSQLWSRHLDWSTNVARTYADIMKLYYATRMDMDQNQLSYGVKDELWNLSLFDNARAMLGAITGAAAATGDQSEPSSAQKAIGGAMSGAAAGAMIGGPVGGLIGGILGGAAGLF